MMLDTLEGEGEKNYMLDGWWDMMRCAHAAYSHTASACISSIKIRKARTQI